MIYNKISYTLTTYLFLYSLVGGMVLNYVVFSPCLTALQVQNI